jgi:hypothetical protein
MAALGPNAGIVSSTKFTRPVITVFRPAFVVFDQTVLERLGMTLLDALASDPRTLGTRILVAIRKGSMGFRLHNRAVYATIEEPFNADEIVAIVNRTPVETLELEPAASKA